MGYFAFLVSQIFCSPLALEFKYVGVNVIGTSLHGSIFSRSPLCRGDCLVDVLPETLIVFGRMVITTTSPHLNLQSTSSNYSCSIMYLLNTLSSTISQDYRIHESNRSLRALVLFIVFCLLPWPMVIFPTIVTLNFNPPSSLTLSLPHQQTNQTVFGDCYSHFLLTQSFVQRSYFSCLARSSCELCAPT